MTTPGGFKDGRLYSLDNLPPLTYNKIWVGNSLGFPIEADLPGGSNMTTVSHNGTIVGTEPVLNLIDGANVTLTVANNTGTNSIDLTIASSGGGGGAPTNATYITRSINGTLTAEFSLGTLANGILRNTTTTGVGDLTIDANATALSNLTPSNGTLIYGNGSTWITLGVGTNGQVLTLAGGIPSWTTGGSGIDYTDDGNVSLFNFFVGSTAGNGVSVTGTENWGVGINALISLTGGGGNTAAGFHSLENITTGANNTAFGSNAFANGTINAVSSGNSAFGSSVSSGASNATLTNCTFVGFLSSTPASTLTNSGAFGYNSSVNISNAISIGANVNVGINQASPIQALHVSASGPSASAAIFMDNTSNTNIPGVPTDPGGLIYVKSSTGTLSDELWFQPGTGSATQLNGGGGGGISPSIFTSGGQVLSSTASLTPAVSGSSTFAGQVLISDLTTPGGAVPFWTSRLIDNSSSKVFMVGSTAGPSAIGTLTGLNNVGAGLNILPLGTSAANNVCFGAQILTTATTANDNTVMGYQAGKVLTGSTNTIMGSSAGFSLSTGGLNTFIGGGAGSILTTGGSNTYVGYGTNGTAALSNSGAFGASTLVSASNAINIGFGVNVGLNKTSPNQSLHVGIGAVASIAAIQLDISSATPTAVASGGSLYVASSGGSILADQLWYQPGTGSGTAPINITGLLVPTGGTTGQVLITEPGGAAAWNSRILDTGTGGTSSYFAGSTVGNLTVTGANNVGVGINSLTLLTSGQGNTTLGTTAGAGVTSGPYNTLLGTGACNSLQSGEGNTVVGRAAGGALVTGSFNTSLGSRTNFSSTAAQGQMALGYAVAVLQDYSTNIGYDSGVPNACNVGINIPSPLATLHVGFGTDGAGGVNTISNFALSNTTGTAPTAIGTCGMLYVTSTPTTTNADRLYFLSGSGVLTELIGGSIPGGATEGQLLIANSSGNPVWGSGLVDTGNVAPYSFFVGETAGNPASGFANTAIGISVLQGMTSSAVNNLACGNTVLNALTDGTDNTGLGVSAGTGVTTGSFNLLLGNSSGITINTGSFNTLLGSLADVGNGASQGRIAIGYAVQVLQNYSANIGYNNPGSAASLNLGINIPSPKATLDIGYSTNGSGGSTTFSTLALLNSTGTTPGTSPAAITGSGMLFVDSSTGTNADQLWFQPGTGTVFQVGERLPTGGTQGQVLTINSSNIQVWGSRIVDGASNLFVGSSAGNLSLIGTSNVAFGLNVLTALTNPICVANTGVGQNVLNSLSDGVGGNTAVGSGALTTNLTMGVENTAVGALAGQLVSSSYSTYIGYAAGQNVTTGQSNCLVGVDAGIDLVSGDNNTLVGSATNTAGVNAATLTNAGAFGANTTIESSDAINIGFGVNVGLNQPNPVQSLHVSAGSVSATAAIYMDNSVTPATPATNDVVIFAQSGQLEVISTIPEYNGSLVVGAINIYAGNDTLSAGLALVACTVAKAGSVIIVSYSQGVPSVAGYLASHTIVPGVGFSVSSSNAGDSSSFSYILINP